MLQIVYENLVDEKSRRSFLRAGRYVIDTHIWPHDVLSAANGYGMQLARLGLIDPPTTETVIQLGPWNDPGQSDPYFKVLLVRAFSDCLWTRVFTLSLEEKSVSLRLTTFPFEIQLPKSGDLLTWAHDPRTRPTIKIDKTPILKEGEPDQTFYGPERIQAILAVEALPSLIISCGLLDTRGLTFREAPSETEGSLICHEVVPDLENIGPLPVGAAPGLYWQTGRAQHDATGGKVIVPPRLVGDGTISVVNETPILEPPSEVKIQEHAP